MDLTMDLSVRKEQVAFARPSAPILNPAAPARSMHISPSRGSPQHSVQQPTHKEPVHSYAPLPSVVPQRAMQASKYVQLLSVIEEMGKDIKPAYACNKNSAERSRRAIASARLLVRECQLECDRNSRM